MTLPKEWQQEAEKSSEFQEATYTPPHKITYTHGFIDGATAYKQAVERLLKSKMKPIEDIAARIEILPSFLVNYDLYLELLTELQTLKPTSND
jgi:hypothetical protein